MSVRKYLSELESDRLIELFTDSDIISTASSEAKGVDVTTALFKDLREQYPGVVEAAMHFWTTLEVNGGSEQFMAGAMAGSLVMLHVVRLAAEIDEIGSIDPTSD